MARKDERGVVTPAPIQFNNSASANLPRYDDEHRGPAVADSYQLSHCRIDLAERSVSWPTPASLPPLMVEFAQSVPDDQRADWLRRQANIEDADKHIADGMRSGELPIWVAPIGEPDRLVAPDAIVEADHATVVSGVYRPPNDRGWLYGRPLFVKRADWAKFAARIDAAKKPARENGKFQSRSHDGDERQWLRISKATRLLHRILRTRLAGQEPAPWIDPPADPFAAECDNATHRHRRTAHSSLTMRRALLSGDLTAHLVKDGRSHPLPGWVWENARASESAFHFNWLHVDPFLDHGLHDYVNWGCFVRRAAFADWLANPEASEIGDLPNLPSAFDRDEMPNPTTYREPRDAPFVELGEALTWVGFSVAMNHDEFTTSDEYGFGPFGRSDWLEALQKAMASLSEQASAGRIRVRGRYVENYFNFSAASGNTEYLSDTQLRDFACFDSLQGGLKRGTGLYWERSAVKRAFEDPQDGWRDVEVCRAELLRSFPPRFDDAKALIVSLPASLPGIGPVMGMEEAFSWLSHDRPSYDIGVWQDAAGNLILRDPNGAPIGPRADGSPPPFMEAYRQASRKLHGALRDGSLPAYVAPTNDSPLLVPRFYWNGVNPENLHLVYRGMAPENQGAGCPVLLSRMGFDRWRTEVTASEAIDRAPSVKAGRPPSDSQILAKADELKARGLSGRSIASRMRHELGFENVATTAVRELIRGRWKPSGRPSGKGG
ncbi:hypothetical protein SAMN06295912_1656 [Sphingomonas laterariae]|uniref:Uncharacterized protein n=1 Tax=Edaphosphingomonas laterariae TaxID=861865 RepID=A0A239KXC6_9SPHN|nr:hypothetical protein [Sphingomonas laterariae]SNT22871.1 hypothetical protein SAMN06295912_1656 [Sphingomonas laterariae]